MMYFPNESPAPDEFESLTPVAFESTCASGRILKAVRLFLSHAVSDALPARYGGWEHVAD